LAGFSSAIGLIDCSDGVGAIGKMFVHSDHRGPAQRIAARLLSTLVDEAIGSL
jgi:hypothetical protein